LLLVLIFFFLEECVLLFELNGELVNLGLGDLFVLFHDFEQATFLFFKLLMFFLHRLHLLEKITVLGDGAHLEAPELVLLHGHLSREVLFL